MQTKKAAKKVRCNICHKSFETHHGMRVHRFRAHRHPGKK